MRIIGIDPALTCAGWGVVDVNGSKLSFVSCGDIKTNSKQSLPERLREIDASLSDILHEFKPQKACVEETFVNRNPQSALKLGQARGVCLLAPARFGIPVVEFSAKVIKKAITGTGGADKTQMGVMIRQLLPKCGNPSSDAADALAAAICCAFNGGT